MTTSEKPSCMLCAWRETCQKRFFEPSGGARCLYFSRDLKIKDNPAQAKQEKEEEFEEILPGKSRSKKQ